MGLVICVTGVPNAPPPSSLTSPNANQGPYQSPAEAGEVMPSGAHPPQLRPNGPKCHWTLNGFFSVITLPRGIIHQRTPRVSLKVICSSMDCGADCILTGWGIS